jgi:hypothetical protein
MWAMRDKADFFDVRNIRHIQVHTLGLCGVNESSNLLNMLGQLMVGPLLTSPRNACQEFII